MTDIIPKPQQDIALRQNVFKDAKKQTSQELGYDVSLEKLNVSPDLLPEQEQAAIKKFDEMMHDLAIAEWAQRVRDTRRLLAIVIESQQRRALAWMNLQSVDDLAKAGLQIADSMPESGTKRQIQSFYRNHLPALDRADVPMGSVNRLMAESDRMIFETSRAISRVEKADKTESEKNEQVQEIISDALTLPHASDLRKKWLNSRIQIPRDVFYSNQAQAELVTFVCSDDEQKYELNKRTESISTQFGNTLPVLESTQIERMKNQLRIALAIAQSGELEALSLVDSGWILDVVGEFYERTNND